MFEHRLDHEVSIRMFTEADAEEFYLLTMASKEYLKEWLGWLDQIHTIEDTLRHIRGSLESFLSLGGYPSNFAICYRGQIAGTIGFNQISQLHRTGSIGYWLGEDFNGKGIMSRAFQEIIRYGFEDLQLNRIELRIAEENHKSRAIPERFGFVEEGKIRDAEWLYDHYVDHILYSLLAREWQVQAQR